MAGRTKPYEPITNYNAECRKCGTKFDCKGFKPCPNCASIHRVDYLKAIGDPTYGSETEVKAAA